jgi:hypothetical protein
LNSYPWRHSFYLRNWHPYHHLGAFCLRSLRNDRCIWLYVERVKFIVTTIQHFVGTIFSQQAQLAIIHLADRKRQ